MNPVEALLSGGLVILPTDTVYGLCASAAEPEPARRLYAAKRRDPTKPSALLAADLEGLRAALPELSPRADAVASALLPGPYTLVLPNPARRYSWIAGSTPDSIGVRVPVLPEEARTVVAAVGCVVATSANAAGGADPRRIEEIPAEIREAAAAVVDVGELPGTPSTVLDVTGPEPRVIREGAVPAAAALELALAALG